jgi:hypothetical protein
MRWNAYLLEGKTTPKFKPLEVVKPPSPVKGMAGLEIGSARELMLQEIKIEHHMLSKSRHEEHSDRRHVDHDADVIPISSHHSFHAIVRAVEDSPSHHEHGGDHHLHHVGHYHENAERAESPIELRTDVLTQSVEYMIQHRYEHAHHEHEGRHEAIPVLSMISNVEQGAIIRECALHEEHHFPHYRAEDVTVAHHHGHHHHSHHHHSHHHGHHHSHHGHHHDHHRHHEHTIHVSHHNHGPSEHETFYFNFQQPWTAILIGMKGEDQRIKAATASAQGYIDKYAVNIRFPRKRLRQPKVTVADAYPPHN